MNTSNKTTSFRQFSACLFLLLFAAGQLTAQPDGDSEAAAVNRMRLIGAIVTTNDAGRAVGLQFPEGVGSNEQGWHRIAELTELRELDLGALYVGNDMLRHVGKLTKLKSLNLFGNPLDSIALKHIENLQQLETLYLYRTFIDDAGMESIAKLKGLRQLNLFDTFLTDVGLDRLGQCKQLRSLSIGNSKAGKFPESFFSEAGIERLKTNLPKTEITLWGAGRHDIPEFIQRSKSTAAKKHLRPLAQPIAVASDLSSPSAVGDWPCFLGPNRNGKSSDKGISKNWFNDPPKLLWHTKIGTGFAAPTIAKGRVLLYQRVASDRDASEDAEEGHFAERLSCLRSDTGEEIWSADFPTSYQDLNGYARSTPLVDEDRVFILSPAGILRCLQLVDGKEIWELDLTMEFDCDLPTYGMGASPVVHGNLLLVVVGGRETNAVKSTVVALDKSTGAFRYGVGDHPASYATPVLHNFSGRQWCFLFSQNGLLTFNPDDGKLDSEFPWQANIAGAVNAASPIVGNDQVFFSESYRLGGVMLRYSPGQPEVIWKDSRQVREKAMSCHWNTPILHEGYIYGCSGRHRSHGKLKCIHWDSGRTAWEIKHDGRSSLTYADGHFFNLSETGLLTFFRASPEGYVEVGRLNKDNSRIQPSYPAWTAPVVVGGRMYLRGKHELICYELKST